MVDIIANVRLNIDHFGLNVSRMEMRTQRKIEHLRRWHQMLARGDD